MNKKFSLQITFKDKNFVEMVYLNLKIVYLFCKIWDERTNKLAQTSKISFVGWRFFAEIARRNIHLSTDSLFYIVVLQEDCIFGVLG